MVQALLDRTGRRFGRLVVLGRAGSDRQGRATWTCLCDCGVTKVIPSRHLGSGAVVSCGCYGRSLAAANGRTGALKISGPRSHLFKPDLTDAERNDRRNLPEVREWRRAVFERDDFICDFCGSRGLRLAAHHLNSWADHPAERFDLANGVTLCMTHHRRFHEAMGGPRVPCLRQDYIEFKAAWYLNREIERRS